MRGRTACVERDSKEGAVLLSHCEQNTDRKLDSKCFRESSFSGLHSSSLWKAVVCHPHTFGRSRSMVLP